MTQQCQDSVQERNAPIAAYICLNKKLYKTPMHQLFLNGVLNNGGRNDGAQNSMYDQSDEEDDDSGDSGNTGNVHNLHAKTASTAE